MLLTADCKTENINSKTAQNNNSSNMAAAQMTMDEVKAIADKVFKAPYNEAQEGKLEFPDYNGNDNKLFEEWKTNNSTKTMWERPTNKIADSALDFVGNTPLIRLSRLHKALNLPEEIELCGKAECYSAGGSVKDRIAQRMIEDAEESGRIKPGDVLIEPTSGNTGVGLCMAGAIKGYKVIITMPMKMSGEKLNMMKALGATIYRTPTEAGWNDTDSHIALAIRMQKAIPNSHILDQYMNPGNPLAHYDYTAEEILKQTDGKIDYMVASAGTGGTMTGIARKLKEKVPGVKIIGVDPAGSILAKPAQLNEELLNVGYHVEGIGYDFIPTVCDQDIADHWVKTKDAESFQMARTLIRREGIMIGGSCGAVMAGAMKAIKELNITKGRVCVLFADSTRNYMSKFLDDAWMTEKGFPLEIL